MEWNGTDKNPTDTNTQNIYIFAFEGIHVEVFFGDERGEEGTNLSSLFVSTKFFSILQLLPEFFISWIVVWLSCNIRAHTHSHTQTQTHTRVSHPNSQVNKIDSKFNQLRPNSCFENAHNQHCVHLPFACRMLNLIHGQISSKFSYKIPVFVLNNKAATNWRGFPSSLPSLIGQHIWVWNDFVRSGRLPGQVGN